MTDNFKILVVEDDTVLRRLIGSLFVKFATVYEAESGNEAIEYLKSNSINLVFSDVCMPNGSGIELLDWAKTNLAEQCPAIVLVTGQAALSPLEALAKGAHSLVDKPFKVKDLMQIAFKIKAEIDVRHAD